MHLIEELRWRGMLQDIIPGTEEYLKEQKTAGYIGFDPTGDSLHVGSLVPIFLLMHMQRAGHTPVILIGGATGMVGDPSGKSQERSLLSTEQIEQNIQGVRKQFEKFLDFQSKDNPAVIVNNLDWMQSFSFIDFIRDVGKHITVNYMLAKDSVKNRIESGISFTEFSYQLMQAYDFHYLYTHYQCHLQCGGSDQWGNITTGTELIRKLDNEKAYAFTCPLMTKSDGGKFGKTEAGNIWLDPEKTSPYAFYQFWINATDEDAYNYIKVFTFKTKEEIDALIEEHRENPGMRILQKTLAEELTTLVHSKEALKKAEIASTILFGQATMDDLNQLNDKEIDQVFDGVPICSLSRKDLTKDIPIIDFLAENITFIASKSEARRALKEQSIQINKQKVSETYTLSESDILQNEHILIQRGRKKYFLIKVVD